MNISENALLETSSPAPSAPSRRAAYRTKGQRHGPITRLMSPGDVGGLVKPFVFLDWFESESFGGRGFGAHPHSGIATHTTLLAGHFEYGDSTGKRGELREGDVEWMQAGGGVWHWGTARPNEPVRGYQLWVALPPALEHAPAASHYLHADALSTDGVARVLLGTYGSLRSPIPFDEPVTYLHVTLAPGQRFTFRPNPGHDVAWLASHTGALRVGAEHFEREMVVFEEGAGAIEVEAIGSAELVIASAQKHPHPLVLGSYSVHTSDAALVRGEQGIEAVARLPLVRDAIARSSR